MNSERGEMELESAARQDLVIEIVDYYERRLAEVTARRDVLERRLAPLRRIRHFGRRSSRA